MTDSAPQDAAAPRTSTAAGPTPAGRRMKRFVFLAVVMLAAWFARNWMAQVPAGWARQALVERDDAAAERYLEYAAWLAPRLAEAEFLRARLSRHQGDYPTALEQLRRAESLGWPAVQIELERWLVEAESGRTRQAAAVLSQITANPHAEPAEIFGAFVRGCLKSRRSFPHAFGLLRAWSGNYPDDPEPQVLIARMSAEVRDWPRVEQALQHALEIKRDDASANFAFGELLVARQRFAEALKQFQVAARNMRPTDTRRTAAALTREAECLRRLGRLDEARRLLDWVVREHPDDRAARVQLALVDLQQRRPADAIPHLQRVLGTHPEHPDANLAMGQAQQATGGADEAQRHFQRASQAQAQLNRISDLTWKVIENPDAVEMRREIATIHLKYGEEVAAFEWFDSVFDLAPDHEPSVRTLIEHFRTHPTGRDPDSPLVKHYARRFGPTPDAASSGVSAGALKLPALTRVAWQAAQDRWQAAGPESYEIEVQVAGRQAATYRTTVHDGQVARALRNGLPLTQSRTAGAWSVPGMFTTMHLDLERNERAARGEGPGSSFQTELSARFHPQWGFPEQFHRVEHGTGSTNPDVSWVVVRFDVLGSAENSP